MRASPGMAPPATCDRKVVAGFAPPPARPWAAPATPVRSTSPSGARNPGRGPPSGEGQLRHGSRMKMLARMARMRMVVPGGSGSLSGFPTVAGGFPLPRRSAPLSRRGTPCSLPFVAHGKTGPGPNTSLPSDRPGVIHHCKALHSERDSAFKGEVRPLIDSEYHSSLVRTDPAAGDYQDVSGFVTGAGWRRNFPGFCYGGWDGVGLRLRDPPTSVPPAGASSWWGRSSTIPTVNHQDAGDLGIASSIRIPKGTSTSRGFTGRGLWSFLPAFGVTVHDFEAAPGRSDVSWLDTTCKDSVSCMCGKAGWQGMPGMGSRR